MYHSFELFLNIYLQRFGHFTVIHLRGLLTYQQRFNKLSSNKLFCFGNGSLVSWSWVIKLVDAGRMTGVSCVVVFFARDRLQQHVSDSSDLRQRRRLSSDWRHGAEPGRRQGRALSHAQLRRDRVLRPVCLQGTVRPRIKVSLSKPT